MKNIEITGSIKEKMTKGKKFFLTGCMAISMSSIALSGCVSESSDSGIINEGEVAEQLGDNESQNLEIGTIIDKIPNAGILDKEDKGYLAYYEMYKKDENGEWYKTETYGLSDGDVKLGYERLNEANTRKSICTGYMIVPIKYEKVEGTWKKFGKDMIYTESDEWIEIKNKIRTDEQLENSRKSSFVYDETAYQKILM